MARQPISTRAALAPAGVAAAIAVALGLAISVLGLGRTATPSVAGPPPTFVDATALSGLAFTYEGPFAYAVGGGVAVFDCDDDGRPDVYLAGGVGPAALFRNASEVGGALAFTRVRDPVMDLTAVNGAYPLDVDGDGHADLVTLRYGENVALRGLGDCRFERANESWGLDGGAEMTEAFSATWEAGNAWPTFAFGNYADPESRDPATWCQSNALVRPAAGAGSGGGSAGGRAGFGPPLLLDPSFCALSVLFSAWDGSRRMDLRVSNDRHYYLPADGEEQLWRIAPGEAPRLYGVDDGWARVQVQGMGIASQDLTGDGLPEVYLTSQSASKLQTLAAGPARPSYRDIGLARGVNVAQPFTGDDVNLPSTAWHPEFADVNNDGFIDLFISKGNVTSQPEYAIADPSNLLLGQPDGTFRETADVAGILAFDRGRGAALADFNLDGRLDLIQVNYQAPVRIWRNSGPADAPAASRSHWLALRLAQPGPNADGIGAWIEVTTGGSTIRRELTVGGGHAGGQLGWSHFGLGDADGAGVRVVWPDGETGPLHHVVADGFFIVDRGANEARRWEPPTP